MMNEEKKSCSFTGHRQILSEHRDRLEDLIERAIDYAYSVGCRRFYSGGAIGFDTLAAKAVLSFKRSHGDVELHLLLPCRDQEVKWSDGDKSVYKKLLSSADTVTFLTDAYTSTCMKERNFELVKRADILVAYSGRSFSGSAQTVRMAKEKGIPVYNLYAECAKADEV